MILQLATLALLLFKDTLGSLLQNTVLNGTSLVLTWEIKVPPGKFLFAFKVYEGSPNKEIAIIKKESTVIQSSDRLKGRVFNESSDFDSVPMVFRLRIGPLTMDDDGLVITYQFIDTDAGFLTGRDVIKVTSRPHYCGSTEILNDNYSFQRNSDLRLSTTLCGNPMPTVEWKFPDWVLNEESPQNTTQNITDNGKSKYVYNVTLKNVDVRNCGRKVYLIASNEPSPFDIQYFTRNITVNIKGTPSMVTGISAEGVNRVNKCVRVSFVKVDVGLCDISYHVKFVFLNATDRTFTTKHTTVEDCGESLVNSVVNVAALFNGIVGQYNDVNVKITKEILSTTTTTTVATFATEKITSTMHSTMQLCDAMKGKYGSNAVIGSFFGGVFCSILIGGAIIFAYKLYVVNYQEEPLKSATKDNKEIDNGNYTALDTIQSQRGDYALPSNYTEVADLKATKQSIYVNSI